MSTEDFLQEYLQLVESEFNGVHNDEDVSMNEIMQRWFEGDVNWVR